MASLVRIELTRSTFVASAPRCHRASEMFGCSPRCRAEPSPVICQVSTAYKVAPHAGADYRNGPAALTGDATGVCLVEASGLAPLPTGL